MFLGLIMSREIKFRAWNLLLNKMFYPCTEDNQTLSLYHQRAEVDFWCSDGVFESIPVDHLMQFTGLYDKNGKEIYEGDIVKLVHRKSEKGGWYSNKNEVGEVFFDLKWGAKFNCKDKTQRVSEHWKSELDCFSDASDVVVIGNIHETPELLNN